MEIRESESRLLHASALLTAGLVLAACQQTGTNLPRFAFNPPQTTATIRAPQQPVKALSAQVNGEVVGNGPIRVALLVPKTASGAAGVLGSELANAARLAMHDFGSDQLQLVIKDTRGQASQASVASAEARNEGASAILGPLFSANVSTASAVTQPANLPMIAFSSDTSRARAGVYLLSFAPAADISRTLNYGLSLGASRVVALLPDNTYGRLAEREMRSVLQRGGGQVVAVARYGRDANAMVTAARSVALALEGANGIYIPDGGQAPALLLNSLRNSGVALAGKQVMGSGQWDSVDKTQPMLDGAIYAGADKRNFAGFSRRYKATYGKVPHFNAALGYDAVSLAVDLVRRNRMAPFSPAAITSRGGFNGATGLFRFQINGRLQRGLVVNRIGGGRAVNVSPAPTSFGGAG